MGLDKSSSNDFLDASTDFFGASASDGGATVVLALDGGATDLVGEAKASGAPKTESDDLNTLETPLVITSGTAAADANGFPDKNFAGAAEGAGAGVGSGAGAGEASGSGSAVSAQESAGAPANDTSEELFLTLLFRRSLLEEAAESATEETSDASSLSDGCSASSEILLFLTRRRPLFDEVTEPASDSSSAGCGSNRRGSETILLVASGLESDTSKGIRDGAGGS